MHEAVDCHGTRARNDGYPVFVRSFVGGLNGGSVPVLRRECVVDDGRVLANRLDLVVPKGKVPCCWLEYHERRYRNRSPPPSG